MEARAVIINKGIHEESNVVMCDVVVFIILIL